MKVHLLKAPFKDSFPVSDALIATGWLPGTAARLNSTGESIEAAVGNETLFYLVDDESEVAAPPSGSIATVVYGSGSKFDIDHSDEVAASDATRAYESDVESANVSAELYVGANSKFTATPTGSVRARMYKKPSAANNYTLGVILGY